MSEPTPMTNGNPGGGGGASLSEAQHREVRQIAELQVRRYFDYYLKEVFPKQQQAMQDYTDSCVREHDKDVEAHGRVERRMNRFVWMLIGAAASGGVGGAGLVRILMGM